MGSFPLALACGCPSKDEQMKTSGIAGGGPAQVDGVRGVALVLRSIATVGNYDYQTDVRFATYWSEPGFVFVSPLRQALQLSTLLHGPVALPHVIRRWYANCCR